MKKYLDISIIILAIASLVISISWAVEEGGYEPISLVVSSISGIIALLLSSNFLSKKDNKLFKSTIFESKIKKELSKLAYFINLDIKNNQSKYKNHEIEDIPLFVKVYEQKHLLSKIMLLQDVLIKNTPQKLLVLGKAGTGKSFYLNSICRKLANLNSLNKIPIFIDLKQWHSSNNWSLANQPTVEELYNFCHNYLIERFPSFQGLIRQYFDELHYSGVFVYIFDSFDEIPGFAKYKKGSYLISKVLDVIGQFQSEGRQSNGILGVLACRKELLANDENLYKGSLEIEIQEIGETAVIEKLTMFSYFSKEEISTWAEDAKLDERFPKTPFDLNMLCFFIRTNKTLPAQITNVFSSYIEFSIMRNKNRLSLLNLEIVNIVDLLKKLAGIIILYGEFNIKNINQVTIDNATDIIDFSISSKILRIDKTGDIQFEHRKITEYFYALNLIDIDDSTNAIIYSMIPNYYTLYIFYENSTNHRRRQLIKHLEKTIINSKFNIYNNNVRSSVNTLAAIVQYDGKAISTQFSERFLGQIRSIIFSEDQVNIHKYRYATRLIKVFTSKERDQMIYQVLKRMSVWYLEESIMLLRFLNEKSKKTREIIIYNLLQNIVFEAEEKTNDLLRYIAYHASSNFGLEKLKSLININIFERFVFKNIFAIILFLNPIVFIKNSYFTNLISVYILSVFILNIGSILKRLKIGKKPKDSLVFYPILTLFFFSSTMSKLSKELNSSKVTEKYDHREEMMKNMYKLPKWSLYASVILIIFSFILFYYTSFFILQYIVLILIFSFIFNVFYQNHKDKLLALSNLKEISIDRESIFNSLYSIAVPGNRRSFMKNLEKMDLKNINGKWPYTSFPPHDLGSSYLYRLSILDEKWMESNSPNNATPSMPS